MKIENIHVKCEGRVDCISRFYTCYDTLAAEYSFHTGMNRMIGEIDSQIWSISYLLSMYKYRPKDFTLTETEITVNGSDMSLEELSGYTCYMDDVFPLFKSKKSVRECVLRGIKKNHLDYTPDEIRELFHMRDFRLERPVRALSGEIFRAMAAIGYTHGKQVYCFPWLSNQRFQAYHGHMTDLLDILERLNQIIIQPVGEISNTALNRIET